MSRTRDIITEIASIRDRRLHGLALFELSVRLQALERAFAKQEKGDDELIRYFPVALVACIEGYFRMVIKDFVDSGEPFLTNTEKSSSSSKVDFSILRAVHGKAVTLGELVAHSAPLSRLEHIEAALTILLGTSFLSGLRTTASRWEHEVKGHPAVPMLAQPDTVFADVARTFELRHIVCHEVASAQEVGREEVSRCFESCVLFLRAAEEFVSEALHPGAPLTQSAMNIAAGDALRLSEARLAEAITAMKARLDVAETVAFDESQVKWQAFSNAWVAFVAGERAGTIWPTIAANEARSVVNRRIEQVGGYRRLSDPA